MKGTAFGNRGIRVFLESCYNERKISESLSYVTVRGEGKTERTRGEQGALYTPSHPVPRLVDRQRVYLWRSTKLGDILRKVCLINVNVIHSPCSQAMSWRRSKELEAHASSNHTKMDGMCIIIHQIWPSQDIDLHVCCNLCEMSRTGKNGAVCELLEWEICDDLHTFYLQDILTFVRIL
jgi:hypothetical protein